MTKDDPFLQQVDALLATVSRLFAMEGCAKEVAILSNSIVDIEQTGFDNWNGGTYFYTLFIKVPIRLYGQISKELEVVEKNIYEKINEIGSNPQEDCFFEKVLISPELSNDTNWREKASVWLSGSQITNQGRVRSNNIASRTCDGLLFRSQPEIYLYKAFKKLGVSFAPLPVFIRGGNQYRRIEPDFIVIKDGLIMAIEVDGDTVHEETPAEAHDRITMLLHEGVHIERVKASECNTEEKATIMASKILAIIKKQKESR